MERDKKVKEIGFTPLRRIMKAAIFFLFLSGFLYHLWPINRTTAKKEVVEDSALG